MKKDYIHSGNALTRVLLLAIALLASFQCALALDPDKGRGNVRGLVQTSDGQPAGFVNVSIKGSSKGALTGEQGEYVIRNVA